MEHSINRLRRYQALSQVDRHHRRNHTARVRAVAGLVNRACSITSRTPKRHRGKGQEGHAIILKKV